MNTSITSPSHRSAAPRTRWAGLLAALLGCLLGILGIFAWPIIFSPLALVCGLVGLGAALLGRSMAGVGVGLLASILASLGAIKSPIIWLLIGGGLLLGSTVKGVDDPPAPVDVSIEAAAPLEPDQSPQAGRIDLAAQWLERFSAKAEQAMAQFPERERRYRAITGRVLELGHRMRVLPDTVERSQIAVAISQADIAMDQAHGEVEAFKAAIDTALRRGWPAVQAAITDCLVVGRGDVAADACARLEAARRAFETDLAELSGGFRRLRASYKAQRDLQAPAVRWAERM